MATGILRLESTPPGRTTVTVEPGLPLSASVTWTVASVTRVRPTHWLCKPVQCPVTMSADS